MCRNRYSLHHLTLYCVVFVLAFCALHLLGIALAARPAQAATMLASVAAQENGLLSPSFSAAQATTATISTTSTTTSVPITAALPSVPIRPNLAPSQTQIVTITPALTGAITGSVPLTASVAITEAPVLTTTATITGSPIVTESAVVSATQSSSDIALAAADATYSGVISGTIIANRTDLLVRFFVEGATYLLEARRSFGLPLPRDQAALNLFNCDANLPETQQGCFWDPYLLDKDGFYEIVTGGETGQLASLVLRQAGNPPAGQVWLQNRTGRAEVVWVKEEQIELPPSSVKEISVPTDTPALIYMRNCATLAGESVCEWLPRSAVAGTYYALVEVQASLGMPNGQMASLELQPIMAHGEETVIETPPQVSCRTQVPALNVRSGPGLQYTIVQKVRVTNSGEQATVIAIGRNEDGQWLAVDERIAAGGWIVASNNFVLCEGDINALPVLQPTIAELIPTPVPAAPAPAAQTVTQAPAAQVPDANAPTPGGEIAPVAENPTVPVTPTLTPGSAPPGYAFLTVTNGFDKPIRFTLDQRFRLEPGVSEYDLAPGAAISFVVFPGQIAFTVSSPWNVLSGSADIYLEKDQSRTLWATFVPDAVDAGKWELKF